MREFSYPPKRQPMSDDIPPVEQRLSPREAAEPNKVIRHIGTGNRRLTCSRNLPMPTNRKLERCRIRCDSASFSVMQRTGKYCRTFMF